MTDILLIICVLSISLCGTYLSAAEASETALFPIEEAEPFWTNLEPPDAAQPEPPVRVEKFRQGLRLTFAGGRLPTVSTTRIPDDAVWMFHEMFKADVTVYRSCLVGFSVLQEKSSRAAEWDAAVSRWTKTALLKPGKNEVVGLLHPPNDYAIHPSWGKVLRFEIFMYAPHEGETIVIENMRLTNPREEPTPAKTTFRVLGTDWQVADVMELGQRLKDRWVKPQTLTVEEVETAFRQSFVHLKATHPNATLAVFRNGENGYDPAHPYAVYAGWQDAYWSSHGPDGMTFDRADNRGHDETHEVFMRHRSPLMRVDVSSIPNGAKILSAKLLLVRAQEPLSDYDPNVQPNLWVAEPCNRPWNEYEVNAYEYAKNRFWKEIGGRYYGDDPDFLPLYIAYGQGSGSGANAWDFTEAVRFWTGGEHPNHGFMLHGDAKDYMIAYSREAQEVRNRPALLVIYERNQ